MPGWRRDAGLYYSLRTDWVPMARRTARVVPPRLSPYQEGFSIQFGSLMVGDVIPIGNRIMRLVRISFPRHTKFSREAGWGAGGALDFAYVADDELPIGSRTSSPWVIPREQSRDSAYSEIHVGAVQREVSFVAKEFFVGPDGQPRAHVEVRHPAHEAGIVEVAAGQEVIVESMRFTITAVVLPDEATGIVGWVELGPVE